MGLLEETRFIERQQFFNGQRLFASDLQELEAFNREMRWLHNRSLHQPGIGNGFAVTGEKGAREVQIGAGYAIDAGGREIVLTDTWTERVPPVSGESDGSPVYYDLTVSYPPDEELEEAETRASVCRDKVCQPRGVVRLREEPIFCWVRLKETEAGNLVAVDSRLGADIEQGWKIVLARAAVLNCQLNQVVSLAQRRSARPSKQPYLACGAYKPDTWDFTWLVDRDELKALVVALLQRLYQEDAGGDATLLRGAGMARVFGSATANLLGPFILPFGIRATVDTRKAGFLTTPCYTARIDGTRQNEIDLSPLMDDPEGPG